ncbi:enoyl-CoA hydratase/isomerase family protein [Sulfobacillus harzensis]|uniref:Enoyl-CoA hydratase/isomerase family protein n=1 Tax=Sulfobacillus harzensis TaxID=2729629 RepID=A0A7Y0Q3J5_9FIRM|nr:enoyl-CoA hydratase-related protein [Sulfobacillus harzensis]NMP23041.1 enoyl-CoA hydratase/isomerase family protein [Sulfobacillus harzensis]
MSNLKVIKGPVTEVAINRPEVRNALNTETIEELITLLEAVGSDPAVEVVILTGTGERAFCAGADLSEVRALSGEDAVRSYFGNMARLIGTLQNLPQPVIGAVFGYTLAGGMGLAAGVDLLIAADDTRFGLPEVKVGLYPMVVTAPISRLIGPRRALELGLTGKMIDVKEATEWGFVNRVVPKAELMNEAHRMAEEIRAGSPFIARLGKEGWRLAQDMEMGRAMEMLKNLVSMVALSEDSQEGVSAFVEKRAPEWPSRQGR